MPLTHLASPPFDRAPEILTPAALIFVAELHRRFSSSHEERLTAREIRRSKASRTGTLDFLPETAAVRSGDWQVAAAPAALQDRRVEITGRHPPPKWLSMP
jgi:malate synthase